VAGRCVRIRRELGGACGRKGDSCARCGRNLSVRSAARLVFAAGRRAIRLINQDVIVARRADHAVNRLAELIVRGARGVFAARLFAADGHGWAPIR